MIKGLVGFYKGVEVPLDVLIIYRSESFIVCGVKVQVVVRLAPALICSLSKITVGLVFTMLEV